MTNRRPTEEFGIINAG